MNSTTTDRIGDGRDWAFGLLLRHNRLRLELCGAPQAAREWGSGVEGRSEAVSQARSLADLAAIVERLCARGDRRCGRARER